MSDCIFCKIVKGEIPSVKVWEDDSFLAILDINPNTEGMTLVLPKSHFDSDAFLMPEKDYNNLYIAVNKIQKLQAIQWESYWYENKKSNNFNYEFNLYQLFKLWTGFQTNSPVLYTKDQKKQNIL